MAGEVFLGIAAEAVLSRLVSVVAQEINLAWGFQAELKKLSTKSTMILTLLHDAGRRQVKRKFLELWLKNLNITAYAADEVLEDFSFEMLRRKLEKTNRMKNKASNFFSPSNPFAFRRKMGPKVNAINMMLDKVFEEGTKLGLHQAGESTSKKLTNRGSFRHTHPFIDESKVFGREADKSKVTNMLLNFESVEQLSFVAIVGLGGLGKTTLAQLIYKESHVREYFVERIWICVSYDFSVTRILKEMAESLKLDIGGISNTAAMIVRLAEKLEGKNYLLVLDDVWNTNAEKWDLLANSLLGINGYKGSKVLVTTRSDEVVLAMQTLQSYHLKKLSEEESWSIFQQRAFSSRGEKETPYLVDVGKKLVKRCGGIPLALTALGDLLYFKERHDWKSMEQSFLWELFYEETGIMSALRLSFNKLSLSLKQCFAYCSLFPKDFLFEKDNLIQLWIAQGFIQASQSQERKLVMMEDIGSDYFNSLLWISFFQDVKVDIYGNITHCKMHDLVHDLAILVSESECLTLDANNVNIYDIEVVRHLSTGENEDIVQTIPKVNARRLRTLSLASYIHDNFLKKFKYLRVLTFKGSKIKELPAKIGKLKHLRYLDVSDTEITIFPTSVSKLYNVQTLRLMNCKKFEKFPEELANLVNLRHLYFNYGKMPCNIGQLTSLQTLLRFRVCKDNGHQIEELGPLSKLRNKVKLLNLELVRDKEEAKQAKLWQKKKLYKLCLVWSTERESAGNDEYVLEGLQLPPNLKSLTIQSFWGGNLSSWMMVDDTMNNNGHSVLPQSLVKIKLMDCKNCQHIPTFGELPFLRILVINGMHNVRCIGTEFYGKNECGARTSSVDGRSQNEGRTLFPSLESLSLKNMGNLVEWTGAGIDATCLSVVVFPRLQTLSIEECFNLRTIPNHFPSLRDLHIIDVESAVPIAQISSNKVTTLKDVTIQNVSGLTSLPEELFENNKKNLTSLSISICKKLSYIPPDGLQMVASSLEYLKINECPKLMSIPSLQGLTSLRGLEISGCDDLTSLPIGLGTCTSLERLSVNFCPNLFSVPAEDLRELKSLSILAITRCDNLNYLPLEGFLHCLTRLGDLKLGGFSEELESFPFNFSNPRDYIHQHLQGLKYLSLVGWPTLKSLPDQIRHLPALRELSIVEFDGVEALPEWLGDLSSLQWLGIYFCNNLKFLPSAESIKRLTNLKWLLINECSLSTQRCKKGEGGTEWSKISHIPNIRIDGVVIQDLYQEKETRKDKEMRQPKDVETLIAPSGHWSIPTHEVENKYDIETKKGKMMQRQGTEARNVSIAGIRSSMTLALSDEAEAESEIFQEREPPSSVKSAAESEIRDLYQEKETRQDKEMRQPKDVETLIAPSVHWSIPTHEVEKKYDIETTKGKMMQRQGTEARNVSIAGIRSSMTPAISDEAEAESEIFQEREPPSSVKSAAGSETFQDTEVLYPDLISFEADGKLSWPETEIVSVHESETGSVSCGTREVDQVELNPGINFKRATEEATFPVEISTAGSISFADDTLLTDLTSIELHCQTEGGRTRMEPKINVERSIQHSVPYILGCINEVNTRKIGIYGNGGIGKTTVLKALINYQELKDLFELIIWVTVSKYWSTRKIQNEIVRQLEIDFADSESDSEIAEKLFHALRSKRFLLLLDDVWDWIDLVAVGIPDPSNGVGCRIIMATRSLHVCRMMAADREVKVEGLSRDQAWELFHKQLGKIIDSPHIQSFARAIVEGCGGLPLTIIVTGRALRDENDVLVWRKASSEFFLPSTSGLLDTQTAIHQLKFGYDRLRSREERSFFLYCALFPENHEIHISALIDYFIKEGVIGGDLRDAHTKGHAIVELLVNAALLERSEGGLSVKMHDMIRDLAKVVLSTDPEAGQLLVGVDFKLTRPAAIPDEEQNLENLTFERHKFLLRAGAGLTEPPPKQEWENPQLICLMDNTLTSLPDTPSCPNLSTLLLQRNYQLRVLPPSFFDSMPSLQYLNLSETRIKSLPSSLSKLTSLQALILRDCNRFAMLPSEVGLLEKLKILDLRGTEINKLPNEIGKLVCLKHLEVSFYGSTSRSENVMLPPELIPRGMISNLPELEKLNVVVHPEDQRWRRSVEYVILEVGSLTKLTVLSFYFPEIELLKLFLEMSPSWKGKGLTNFNFVVGHNVERIVARVPEDVDLDFGRRGKCLRFINSDMIPDAVVEVLTRTTAFYLDHHFTIGSLSEFGLGNIRRLEFCVVRECPKMHTIIDKTDVANAALPFLERLSIHYLWSLMRIWETMTMPSGSFARLRILSVHTCPKLSFVFHCSMLQCFTKLEELVVEDCPAMKEIIIWDEVVNPGISILPSLKKLTLHYLPGLVNIWRGHWPLLEQISFYNCSNLKNLGMDSNLEHTLKEIKAEKDWWDALAWEETALFLHLQDRFCQITDDDL